MVVVDQPFDAISVGESEDGDLVPLQSGEDWIAQLDDDFRYARSCDFCGIIKIIGQWMLMGPVEEAELSSITTAVTGA